MTRDDKPTDPKERVIRAAKDFADNKPGVGAAVQELLAAVKLLRESERQGATK